MSCAPRSSVQSRCDGKARLPRMCRLRSVNCRSLLLKRNGAARRGQLRRVTTRCARPAAKRTTPLDRSPDSWLLTTYTLRQPCSSWSGEVASAVGVTTQRYAPSMAYQSSPVHASRCGFARSKASISQPQRVTQSSRHSRSCDHRTPPSTNRLRMLAKPEQEQITSANRL
jgi:hypothetical protein